MIVGRINFRLEISLVFLVEARSKPYMTYGAVSTGDENTKIIQEAKQS